jgi:Skp family chaperone for outer membrane proteins
MKAISTRVNWTSVALLTILAAFVGSQSWATRAAPVRPAVVATVNLERALNSLDERSAAAAALKTMAEGFDVEATKKRDGLELLSGDIDLYPAGSVNHREKTEELARRTYNLQAYIEFAARKLELAKSKSLHDSYIQLKKTVAELSEKNGYDMVFVNDAIVLLPENPLEAETMRQISARRMLYSSGQIDITDDLIAAMNETFQLQGP